MNDASPVRGVQPTGECDGHVDERSVLEWSAVETISQRLALQQLHDDEPRTIRTLADVVNGADVGMVERRNRPRLAFETLKRLAVGSERLGEHFERHNPVQPHVVGTINLAHAAAADRGDDLVRTEAQAWSKHDRRESGEIISGIVFASEAAWRQR